MRHVVLAMVLLVATVALAEESPGEFSQTPQTKGGLMAGASWESQYVWRGWATARINEAADPTTQKRNTAEAVRKILARFPAQGTQ